MSIVSLFRDPIFTLPMTVKMVRPDRYTIDNWLRGGFATATGEGVERRFSMADHLKLELLFLMRERFSVQMKAASVIADGALRDYEVNWEKDLVGLRRGEPWSQASARETYSLVRGDNGELRPYDSGDLTENDVMIVLPVQLLARKVMAVALSVIDSANSAEPAEA